MALAPYSSSLIAAASGYSYIWITLRRIAEVNNTHTMRCMHTSRCAYLWATAVPRAVGARFPPLAGMEHRPVKDASDYCIYPYLKSAVALQRSFIRLCSLHKLVYDSERTSSHYLNSTNPMR